MNVAYAPIAQTILVDKRHEQGFAAKVSTIDPRTMPRRTWQFVDTARHYDDTGAHANILTGEQDGDWLSGKLRYRDDSPLRRLAALADPGRTIRRPMRPPSTTPTAPTVRCRPTVRSNPAHAASTAPKTAPRSSDSSTKPTSTRSQRRSTPPATRSAKPTPTTRPPKHSPITSTANSNWPTSSPHVLGAHRHRRRATDHYGHAGRHRIHQNDPKLAELAKQRDELNAELDRVERQRIESDQAAARAAAPSKRRSSGCATMPTPARRTPPVPPPTMTMTPRPARCRRSHGGARRIHDNRFAGLADAAMRAMIIGAGAAGTQAPGESLPERTIAGIGSDMASRINPLNGQADAARTGVESKMSTYIALYAADDDSLTASVEDYRYYLDELASLTQLAAVAATDAEYRRCSNSCSGAPDHQTAIDTDASDIHDQLDRINAMLKGQQFRSQARQPVPARGRAVLSAPSGRSSSASSAPLNEEIRRRQRFRTPRAAAFAACAPMVGCCAPNSRRSRTRTA